MASRKRNRHMGLSVIPVDIRPAGSAASSRTVRLRLVDGRDPGRLYVLSMNPSSARLLAGALLRHANEAEGH